MSAKVKRRLKATVIVLLVAAIVACCAGGVYCYERGNNYGHNGNEMEAFGFYSGLCFSGAIAGGLAALYLVLGGRPRLGFFLGGGLLMVLAVVPVPFNLLWRTLGNDAEDFCGLVALGCLLLAVAGAIMVTYAVARALHANATRWMPAIGRSAPALAGFILIIAAPFFLSSMPRKPVHYWPPSEGDVFYAGETSADIAFDGTNVWVANHGSVTKMRCADGSIAGTYSVWATPRGIAYDGEYIWVGVGQSVTKLRASDGEVVGSYSVGCPVADVAFDGARIWVATYYEGKVIALSASDGSLVGKYDIETGSFDLVFDGTHIWVAGTSHIAKLDPSNGSVMATCEADQCWGSMAFDGTDLWATDLGSDTVSKIGTSDGSVLATYKVGKYPQGITFDGTCIWVANCSDRTVMQLAASDGSRVRTWNVGGCPKGMVFDGTHIWVAKDFSSSVTRLPAGEWH